MAAAINNPFEFFIFSPFLLAASGLPDTLFNHLGPAAIFRVASTNAFAEPNEFVKA